VGVASRELTQVLDEQGVAGDVDRQVGLAGCAELQDAAHHLRQRGLQRTLGVPPRRRGHPQPGPVLGDLVALPGVEGHGVDEALQPEPTRCLPSGEDRHILGQAAPGHPVEVVAVQVREHDGVERRKAGRLQGRLRPALGPHPLTEVGLLPPVQEVGIGQDRDAAVGQQGGGRTDHAQGTCHPAPLPFRGRQRWVHLDPRLRSTGRGGVRVRGLAPHDDGHRRARHPRARQRPHPPAGTAAAGRRCRRPPLAGTSTGLLSKRRPSAGSTGPSGPGPGCED